MYKTEPSRANGHTDMTNSVKISRTHVLGGCFEYTTVDNEDAFDRHVYAIYPNCIRCTARVRAHEITRSERYTRQMVNVKNVFDGGQPL